MLRPIIHLSGVEILLLIPPVLKVFQTSLLWLPTIDNVAKKNSLALPEPLVDVKLTTGYKRGSLCLWNHSGHPQVVLPAQVLTNQVLWWRMPDWFLIAPSTDFLAVQPVSTNYSLFKRKESDCEAHFHKKVLDANLRSTCQVLFSSCPLATGSWATYRPLVLRLQSRQPPSVPCRASDRMIFLASHMLPLYDRTIACRKM